MAKSAIFHWYFYLEWRWLIGPVSASIDDSTGEQLDGNLKQLIDVENPQLGPDNTFCLLHKPIQSPFHLKNMTKNELFFLFRLIFEQNQVS